MPGLTGYELARHVRKQPQLHGMVLIAITGWGQATDKARALAEGFDVHMTKPVEVTRLVEVLQDPLRTETLYSA
jgi:CheY-like chemotaxis protein